MDDSTKLLKKNGAYFHRNRKEIFILLIIIFLGAYLRSYNFSYFQKFEDDQIRDVSTVEKMDQSKNFFILGPHALGSDYYLGPIYYYIEYTALKLFGDYPIVFAYPSLFFSILSIPLFYLIFKKIIGKNMSLAISSIYSVSFFNIKYARFAWNSNLLPFFVLAFIFLAMKIIEQKKDPKKIWLVLMGIIIGIGIQLHTLTIFVFIPIIMALFGYFIFTKDFRWKNLVIIIIGILVMNIPAFITDFQNKGANLKALLSGSEEKSHLVMPFHNYLLKDIECLTQGTSSVLLPINQTSACDMFEKQKKYLPIFYYGNLIFFLIFFLGGSLLFYRYIKKESTSSNKIFLIFVAAYSLISFAVYLPLVYVFESRYFFVVFFLPFLYLAFWLKYFIEKTGRRGVYISLAIMIVFFASNLIFVHKIFILNKNPEKNELGYYGISFEKAKEISNGISILAPDYERSDIFISTSTSMRAYRYAIQYYLEKKSNYWANRIVPKGQPLEKKSVLFIAKENDQNDADLDPQLYSPIDAKYNGWYNIMIFERTN